MKISIKTLSVISLTLGLSLVMLGSVSSYAGSKDSSMIGIHPFDQEAEEQAHQDQDRVAKTNENRTTASVATDAVSEDQAQAVARADEEAGVVISPQFKGRNLH